MMTEIKIIIFPLHIKTGQYQQTTKWKIIEIFYKINHVNLKVITNDFTNIPVKHSVITAI